MLTNVLFIRRIGSLNNIIKTKNAPLISPLTAVSTWLSPSLPLSTFSPMGRQFQTHSIPLCKSDNREGQNHEYMFGASWVWMKTNDLLIICRSQREDWALVKRAELPLCVCVFVFMMCVICVTERESVCICVSLLSLCLCGCAWCKSFGQAPLTNCVCCKKYSNWKSVAASC